MLERDAGWANRRLETVILSVISGSPFLILIKTNKYILYPRYYLKINKKKQ